MSRRLVKSSRDRPIEEPVVNLTPLIDVVFVILIMFILVAPLLELDRVELAEAPSNPIEGTITVQESSLIRIHVKQNNTILYNEKVVHIDQLVDLLKEAKRRYPHARPQLFHDQRGHFGVYQSVKNAAEAAGFQQMDIVLKPNL